MFSRSFSLNYLTGFWFLELMLCGCLGQTPGFPQYSVQFDWLSGSRTPNQPGINGKSGIANTPGARHSSAMLLNGKDSRLILFGGHGFGSDSNPMLMGR